MVRYENDCVGCDIPCINCGLKRNPHYYCDKCGEEETLYQTDEGDLCADCILKNLPKVEGSY